MQKTKLIIIDVVGLTKNDLNQQKLPNISTIAQSGTSASIIPSFPAVTCSVQATLTTGYNPSEHGIIANGFFDRDTNQVSFWEQYASLVQKPRVWDILKQKNSQLKTALLFWQNSLYANSDVIITPKPIHLDDQLVMWCYSKPIGFYEETTEKFGEFDLRWYWGPFASIKSSQWIVSAAMHTITKFKPDLMLVYIPHLDYAAQKYGPASNEFKISLKEVDEFVGEILSFLEANHLTNEYGIMILSEYGFFTVNHSISPNLILRENKLLSIRKIKGKEYVDYEHSKAFAMVDHQISHVFIKTGYEQQVQTLFEKNDNISVVLNKSDQKKLEIDNPKSGELILCSKTNGWFNYHWWSDENYAPSFTFNVDIHRKPGFDPLELFLDKEKRTISHDTTLVKGSHGLIPEENSLPLFISDMREINSKIHATQIAPTITKFFKINHAFS
jgi:predicted AlkP superfamily pyrophosphatase or phosphodiesterase